MGGRQREDHRSSAGSLKFDANEQVQAIGGFKGEAQDAPSGINQKEKRELLRSEGVTFDERGFLIEEDRWWDGFRL